MPDQSFSVHLQSLTDFARELATQLDGMGGPVDQLTQLAGAPVLLGEFGEALSLGDQTRAAVAEMRGLLDQVRQAISFAEDVTNTVASGYAELDTDIATGLQVSGQGGDLWT